MADDQTSTNMHVLPPESCKNNSASSDKQEDPHVDTSPLELRKSAAENYAKLATKVFEIPQPTSHNSSLTDATVSDVHQNTLEAKDVNAHQKMTDEQTSDAKQKTLEAKDVNAHQKMTNEQTSDAKQNAPVQVLEIHAGTGKAVTMSAEFDNSLSSEQSQELMMASRDVDLQSDILKLQLKLDEQENGNDSGSLTEEEINHRQRIQDLNQEAYTNKDGINNSHTSYGINSATSDNSVDAFLRFETNNIESPGNNTEDSESPHMLEFDDDSDKADYVSTEIRVEVLLSGSGDAALRTHCGSGANEIISAEGGGGGDASMLLNNAGNLTEADSKIPVSGLPAETVNMHPLQEVITEISADVDNGDTADLDTAERMKNLPHVQATFMQQQQQDFHSQEGGALTSSHQVSVSKCPHGRIDSYSHTQNHNYRGLLPQTVPSKVSVSTTKSDHIPQIPSPPTSVNANDKSWAATRHSQRLTPSLMKMSTVMVSTRNRAILNRQASTYRQEKRTTKLVTLDQCINSRPPMPFDLDGPGPCHYSPRNKPFHETNAPEYSMGCKFYERAGGSRTAWAKSWFNSPDNFTHKVSWEKRWPTPTHYSPHSPVLGRPQAASRSFPSFSIGIRSNFTINKQGSEYEPSPNQYNRERADNLVMRSAPSVSMIHRHKATSLGKTIEMTPSPDKYSPKYKQMSSHIHYPSFTIRGIRREKIHALGPHSTL